MTHFYYYYPTPTGDMTVTENGHAITGISFGRQQVKNAEYQQTPLLKMAGQELAEYFAGRRYEFDLPFEFEIGSDFQQRVWQALFTVPYGQTASYKEIAERINMPKAVRAVGGALHKNPIAICVPCHRVIRSNGHLSGYAGGLDRKQHLLDLEKHIHCCDPK